MLDLSVLNKEQLLPVLDTEGAVLVTAGAGSGKTRLLTYRIAYLMDLGVPAYNILAITFTNKAAREMKERLCNMVEDADQLFVSTFHSMCVRILRRFIDKIGYSFNFSIYDEQDRKKILKEIAAKVDSFDDNLAEAIGNALSTVKNQGLDIYDFSKNYSFLSNIGKITEGMELYTQEMKKRNALDFDDLLVLTYKLLVESKEAREYYQNRFRYIHVDEFQDTNVIQYKLIKILAQGFGNIFVVGDEDQSIYGWRGANIGNIKDFIKDFSCKIYKLEQNYRSSKRILALANNVIKNNLSRIEKQLWTENEEGFKPKLYVANSDGDEAEFIMQTIKELKYYGHSYNDMAVLMRVNALSRSIEQKFMYHGIPYQLYGGFKFYDRKEIKDIIAYLKLLVNPKDDEAAQRVIAFPKKGIGEASIKKMLEIGEKYSLSLYDIIMSTIKTEQPNKIVAASLGAALCAKLRILAEQLYRLEEYKNDKVSLLIKYLYNLLNIDEVFGDDTEDEVNRKLNIRELVNSVIQTEEKNPNINLEDYVQQIMLYSDLDSEPESEAVRLFTIHSAKGLEFDTVFIIGAEEGLFPLSRALNNQDELEEERRLMYVAITRAKKNLYISHTKTRFMYGRYIPSMPSRFLFEAGLIKVQKSPDQKPKENYESKSKENKVSYTPLPTKLPLSGVDIKQLKVGSIIKHKRLGKGIIKSLNYQSGQADVEFETAGVLTLSVAFAPITILD